MAADRDVVRAWVEGWALSRQVPAPVAIVQGWRVDVGLPEHRVRYVFADLDPAAIRGLAESLKPPGAFIKACVESEELAASLPANWGLDPLHHMMTARLGRGGPKALDIPKGYELALGQQGQVIVAALRETSGEIAASGRIALAGSRGIVDQVVTHVDHRRRGLGRVIMQGLEQAAASAGATTAILVATDDGRALYSALGWDLHAPLATAAIRAASV
jgi:GNAT superfamily N-acetyltransferase